jgi:cation transport ATPase
MSNNITVDVPLINARAFQVVQEIDAPTLSGVNQNLASSKKYTNYVNNQSTRQAQGINASTTNLMYHRNTDLIAQLNESWNANRHINNTLNNEIKRLDNHNKVAKVDIYKMRQSEMQLEYSHSSYQKKTRIAIATIIMVCTVTLVVALMGMGRISRPITIILCTVILLAYVLYVISMVRDLGRRRDMDWRRFYWDSKLPNKNDSLDCKK